MSLCLLGGNTYIWFKYALVCSCVCFGVCILLRPVFASKCSWGRCVASRQERWLVSQLRGERFTHKKLVSAKQKKAFLCQYQMTFFFFFLFCTVSSLKKLKNWSHRGEHILCFYQGLEVQLKAMC